MDQMKQRSPSNQEAANLPVPPTTPENEILFQAFEWHTPSIPPAPHETHSSLSHYTRLTHILPSLVDVGITAIWLPPGCKANNPEGNGYDCYDLWDLGEFDQKFARSTRWGSREELNEFIRAAREANNGKGVQTVWDTIFNHKTAGDAVQEDIWAVTVDGADRRLETCPPRKINSWLKYEFPGRSREGMKYSDMRWSAEHFNGTDWDQKTETNAIYKLIDDPTTLPPKKQRRFTGAFSRLTKMKALTSPMRRPGKGWADDVDDMHGNSDYLMFSNVDHLHPAVRTDLLNWGDWMVWDVGVDGFRLDAAQHFSSSFTREWMARIHLARKNKGLEPAFVLGEIWTSEVTRIIKWLDAVGPGSHAFDSPLLYNFSRISEDVRCKSKNADLRTVLRDCLLHHRPNEAVTLVANHDTQPGQSSYIPIDPVLKSVFYAFILLRREGIPCVFWGDLYGTHGPHSEPPACSTAKVSLNTTNADTQQLDTGDYSLLPSIMVSRKLFAYGPQTDYFDAMSCIGFTRSGTRDRPNGCAVIMSIGPAYNQKGEENWTTKTMRIGQPGDLWIDLLGSGAEVRIDEKGEGIFACRGGGRVAIFVNNKVPGSERFPVQFNHDVYGPCGST